jgi:hypothetical protein
MAQENTNTNDPMTVLKFPIIILVACLFLALFLFITNVVPGLQNLSSAKSDYKSKFEEYTTKVEQVDAQKKVAEEAQATATSSGAGVEKGFYKPVESGADSEALIAAEFNEILDLITSNSIKTRAVKYDYDPADDNFVKGAQGKYSVCKLDMQMIASYNNFKNFMKDLYKHEHYLDIAKVEIRPYNKNKNIILIDLQLKLYAEKV